MRLDQVDEPLGLLEAARRELSLVRTLESFEEGDAFLHGEVRDGGLRPVADAALRDVEDASHGDVVGGIDDRAEIRDGVLHFTPLVEPHATDDLVRKPDADEYLFEGS